MQTFEEVSNQIQKDFLLQLVKLLKEGIITTQRAQQLAKDFRSFSPFSSIDDIKQKLEKYGALYAEMDILPVNALRYEEAIKTKDLLDRMQSFMQEDKIDEALALVQTSVKNDIQ